MEIVGEILGVQPAKIKYSVGSNQENSWVIRLTNKTNKCVGFRIKTTHLKTFKTFPDVGILPPGATSKVKVKVSSSGHNDPLAVQTMEADQAKINGKENILILGVINPDGSTLQDINPEMFDEEEGRVIKETNLPILYVPASKKGQEGSSTNHTRRANGINATPVRENLISFCGTVTAGFIAIALLVYFVYQLNFG